MNTIELNTTRLIGLALPHKTTNENGQSAKDCGALWQEFEKGEYIAKIPGKRNNNIMAVYHDYESDHTGPYSYFIGCSVEDHVTVPEGMSSLLIPNDTYEKITVTGTIPDAVADAWKKIWASGQPRAYRFDFELYDERSKDWKNAVVDIFLSIDPV